MTIQTFPPRTIEKTILIQTSKAIEIWAQLLHATGRKLSPETCSTQYIIPNGRQSIQQNHLHSRNMIIKILPPSTSRKYLGVMLNPMPDCTDEYLKIMKQSQGLVQQLIHTKLNFHETMISYQSHIMPQIIYSFPVITLTSKNSRKLKNWNK